jgi:hypothetical protein
MGATGTSRTQYRVAQPQRSHIHGKLVVLDHTWLGGRWIVVMREHASYIVIAIMIVVLYINNSEMGEDGERAALDRVRDSSGYLIRYEQAN